MAAKDKNGPFTLPPPTLDAKIMRCGHTMPATRVMAELKKERPVCPDCRLAFQGISIEGVELVPKKASAVLIVTSCDHPKHALTLEDAWNEMIVDIEIDAAGFGVTAKFQDVVVHTPKKKEPTTIIDCEEVESTMVQALKKLANELTYTEYTDDEYIEECLLSDTGLRGKIFNLMKQRLRDAGVHAFD